MIYLVDPDRRCLVLAGVSGIDRTHPAVLETIDLQTQSDSVWAEVVNTQQSQLISDLSAWGELPAGGWQRPPQQAVVVPIAPSGATGRAGLLVAGLNPFRLFDHNYRSFIDLVAGQIAASVANANAYEAERKRAEALAELDRAKTLFFTNISHEFRTPLTLMLGPIEELITTLNAQLRPDQRQQLALVHRNGLRLQKLVNTLLDFSRIEADRIQAVYEPTDLATYTAELASAFRSLVEQAGLSLIVECPPLPGAIYVDREMWEKIVLNLLSNAFKFTLSGSITVRLRWRESQVELAVSDTGVGIPAADLPQLFERFHRVENFQGRSFEGSGIGLSLVQELVKLHQGTIAVTSCVGKGSCFTVTLPTGSGHLPQDRIGARRTIASTALGILSYVEEAQRWLPEVTSERLETLQGDGEPALSLPASPHPIARILLADDNADVRDYIRRLLGAGYQVETVPDGLAALNAVQRHPPDLVLSDVMMPRMDGFELLRQLRTCEQTQEIPIILLSARAGEEARIEGLAAGADDYLIKPFSARELMARVEATLKLAQLRRAAREREQILQLETEAVRANLERILSNLREGFLTLDRGWRYTYINDRQLEIIGMTREAVIGKNVWEIFPDLVGSEIYYQFHRVMHERAEVHFEVYYPPFDRWFAHRIYPTDEGIAIFVVDVSERMRLEIERQQAEIEREQLLQRAQAAREQAEAANRIKDEFLAVLSHELRTPLNPILGWLSLLRQGKLPPAKAAQAIEIIDRNAKLQVQLIDDLLDISRVLRGKLGLNMAPVDLKFAIQAALDTVRLALDAKGIALETQLDAPVEPVMGDSSRLQQVIWNLLSNAVKFTPHGGRITIALKQVESHAEIQVSDTGKGIQPDFLPYVFEHFRQEDAATTRKFGGLGLGLAIARQIVELHGGRIAVTSPGEGQGSIFTVRIPLLRRDWGGSELTQAAEPAHNGTALDPLANLHVLVVDDDPDALALVAFVLKQAGAAVTGVSSGISALRAIEQFVPDLILSDIGMPEMDGYMLMRQIHSLEHLKQVPAIALTAYASERDQQQAIAAGFQQHIAKPITPEKLVSIVQTVCQTR